MEGGGQGLFPFCLEVNEEECRLGCCWKLPCSRDTSTGLKTTVREEPSPGNHWEQSQTMSSGFLLSLTAAALSVWLGISVLWTCNQKPTYAILETDWRAEASKKASSWRENSWSQNYTFYFGRQYVMIMIMIMIIVIANIYQGRYCAMKCTDNMYHYIYYLIQWPWPPNIVLFLDPEMLSNSHDVSQLTGSREMSVWFQHTFQLT